MAKFFKYDRYNSIDGLKKEWRTIAINNHPDKGGNAEVFKMALAEYEHLLKTCNAGFSAESDMPSSFATWQEFLANVSPCVNQWVKDYGMKVVSLGATIEITGTWIWIGNTSPKIASDLKTMGLKWASHKKLWFFNGEPWHGRKMDMGKIRESFGSTKLSEEKIALV